MTTFQEDFCFLGPEGTFTHQAALALVGDSLALQPLKSTSDIFSELRSGRFTGAVLPFENSVKGYVPATFKAIAAEPLEHVIAAEKVLDVSFTLYRRKEDNSPLAGVASHPFALGQCRRFIQERDLQVEEFESTAAALEELQSNPRPGWGAVGAANAESIYDRLRPVQNRLEDRPSGQTRFVLFRYKSPARSGNDRTVLLLEPNSETNDVLQTALRSMAPALLNPLSVAAYPSGTGLGQYYYLVEISGHVTDPTLRSVVSDLLYREVPLRFIGTFPVDEARERVLTDQTHPDNKMTTKEVLTYVEQ